jgi:N-glycosylase/DNA lyase
MKILLLANRLEFAVREVLRELNSFTDEGQGSSRDPTHLWHELVACLLGSAVPYALAQRFAAHLASSGLLEIERFKNNPEAFEQSLARELSRPIQVPAGTSMSLRRYRFPHLRANHIRRTAELLDGSGTKLRDLIETAPTEPDARRRIVSLSIGIGPKQASLFLRNVGFASGLAILDVHILRFMEVVVLGEPVKPPGSCLSSYERLERQLRKYSDASGVQLGQLDTAIWVVMRAARRENALWH